MKNKLIMAVSVLAMLTVSLWIQGREVPGNRHYQHLEPEKEACREHGDEVFCTHLPLLNIITAQPIPSPYLLDVNGTIRREESGKSLKNFQEVPASIEVFDTPGKYNHLTDEPVLREQGLFRIRGNSSRKFDKKSYLLKFTEEDCMTGKKVSLCGMTADNTWCLHGPFMDRTLVRNYICYHLAGEIMENAPDVRFCEIFVNGDYMGVYLLTEKINFNKNGRVQLTPTDPDLAETSYILKLDHAAEDPGCQLRSFCDFSGKRGVTGRRREHLSILYPGKTLTDDQRKYIKYQISSFERALTSLKSADPREGYTAYIDVDSFVNYMVFNEFTMNADAGTLSTYFSKDVRGKLQVIGWDYNNVFNNYYTDLASPHGFFTNNTWFNPLLRDRKFVDRVVKRYRALRLTFFRDDYLQKLIDDTVRYLGPAVDRNYEKWGYCFTEDSENHLIPEDSVIRRQQLGKVMPLERNPEDYEQSVEMLKAMIRERGAFLDENIHALYAKCHESANKQYLAEGGH